MTSLRRLRFVLVLFAAVLAAAVASRSQALSPAGTAALQAIADTARNPDLRWPDFSPDKTEFAMFYQANGYSLAWVVGQLGDHQPGGHQPRPQALAVIGLLKNADAKGLDAEDYDASRWDGRLAKLAQSPSEQDLVQFDSALTISAMRYIHAVSVGRVNPKEFNFQVDMDSSPEDLADFLQTHVLRASDPSTEIEKLEPPYPGYKKLLALLPVYEAMAAQDDGGKFPVPAKTVLPGQPYAGLTRLAWFLQIIGDAPAGTVLPKNATVYEGALVEAVKHYQSRHGEDVTGRLDARTIQELNTPPADRIRQIRLTLERWRWVPHSFAQPPVVVNIPEFRLRAMNSDGTIAFYKNVIVGKAYGHKSPLFQKEIQYVIFRPYWNVPPSIQRAEIVPHIEKDPEYIAKHDFQVYTPKGEVVTEGAVSAEVLAELKSGRLMVRQKPGATNSLGLVKIIFPNPDNVYLHGTDVPELFSQSVRDFSHGCIRVQGPAELVAWVLRNNPGWNLDRVTSAMDGKQDNVQVNLTTKIPVLIVYGSAAVNEENQVRFFDDVYGYDAELARALAKGYPYPR